MSPYAFGTSRRNPRAFQLTGDDSPSPLHNPDTSYLTSTPQLPTIPELPKAKAHLTRPTDNWQELSVTPNRSSVSADIYVPGPPTPRTPRLHNNTPTPAASTPGSWVERRRPGQAVDRSLAVPESRVNLPDTIESFAPDSTQDRRSVSRATTAADSQESVGSTSLSRQVCQDGPQVDATTSIQVPAVAKIAPRRVASRPSQLDGVPEEVEETREPARRQGICERFWGSLRSVPSMFKPRQKQKTRDEESAEGRSANASAARSTRRSTATHDNMRWLSTASQRLKKSSRRFKRGSLHGVFPQSNSSAASVKIDEQRDTRPFAGPKEEDETGSPVEDPFPHITAAEVAQENELSQEQTPRQECLMS